VRPSPVYSFVAALTWPVVYGPFRLRARGSANLPDSGFVLAANHVSNFDPWPLAIPLWPKRYLRFMAKSELYWWPLGTILSTAGAFPVRRGTGDVEALETAVRLCREGHVVMMFPEGTRRAKGLRKKFRARAHPGAARIALQAGVPLVPAATKGTDRLRRLGPLRVAYGEPLAIDDLAGEDPIRAAREATRRLMEAISELEASL